MDDPNSMLAGALRTGASRTCGCEIMKVAPVGKFAKLRELSHDVIVWPTGASESQFDV
jgi:hypothetical protein